MQQQPRLPGVRWPWRGGLRRLRGQGRRLRAVQSRRPVRVQAVRWFRRLPTLQGWGRDRGRRKVAAPTHDPKPADCRVGATVPPPPHGAQRRRANRHCSSLTQPKSHRRPDSHLVELAGDHSWRQPTYTKEEWHPRLFAVPVRFTTMQIKTRNLLRRMGGLHEQATYTGLYRGG